MFSTPLWADALQDCLRSTEKLHRKIHKDVLESRDHGRLEKIFSSPGLTHKQMAKAAFEVWIDARLRRVPRKLRQIIRQRLTEGLEKLEARLDRSDDEISRLNEQDELAGGLFDGEALDSGVRVWTLPEYDEAFGYYHVLAHELEHLVQYAYEERLVKVRVGVGWVETVFRGHLVDKIEYLREKQAMTAEWEFAAAIPKSLRDVECRQLEADSRIHSDQKEVGLRWLRGGDLELTAYLDQEYSNNRYTLEVIRADRIDDLKNDARRIFMAGVRRYGLPGVASAAFVAVCRSTVPEVLDKAPRAAKDLCEAIHSDANPDKEAKDGK